MRLTSVEIYSPSLEEVVEFSLIGGVTESGYEVRNIFGIDSDEIIPKFYGNSLDGSKKFYNFGMKPRDIVMRIVLKPRTRLEETFSDVRDRLYRSISSNRYGITTLYFKSGGTTVAKIDGSITKFETSLFTKLPEVQITIRCNDPMFKGIAPVLFEAADLPSTNPVKIPDSLSTAPHGFCMQATFTGNVASFTIQDVETDPEWKFKITPDGGFLTDDVLYFSSEYSNRYVYIIRSTNTIHLADKIEATSIWPIIFPGQNEFHFVNIASVDLDSIEYYPSYWGV